MKVQRSDEPIKNLRVTRASESCCAVAEPMTRPRLRIGEDTCWLREGRLWEVERLVDRCYVVCVRQESELGDTVMTYVNGTRISCFEFNFLLSSLTNGSLAFEK